MPRDRYDDEDDDRDDRRRRRDDDEDDDRPRRRRRDEDEDEDDRPRRRSRRRDDDFDRRPESSGNALAVTSLILGIVSLCFGPLTGLVGLILGLVALRKPSGRVLAIIGMVLSGLFTFGYIGLGVWAYLEGQKVRNESNNLKQIGLATHSYHDVYSTFPTAQATSNPWGVKPTQDLTSRLSWRVTILPYIEQENVFRQFRIDEPWDSGTNRPLADKLIAQYADLETPADPTTRIRVFYDNGAMFDTQRGARMTDVLDGTSNTIMHVEGGDKVTWSRFQEYRYDPKGPLPPLGKPNKSTFMVVMGDGSVRNLRKNMNETTLRNLITRADGMVVDFDR
jgi:hypothetical protein